MIVDSIKRPEKPKTSRVRLWLALVMLVLLALGIFIGTKLVIFAEKIVDGTAGLAVLKQFLLAPDKQLQGEAEEEIRILLLGIAGQNHDGATLTDTMILATLKLPKKQDPMISLVSIPRDLVVNIPGYDYRKINSAYAYGGPQLALQTTQQLLGFSIPYYAVIDFEGFKRIVDDLGGVDINVERGFTDSFFPDGIEGYLPPITFQEGREHMNGTRALEFVRSRHGTNSEGTDFARSRRQQLVLKAVKDKLVRLRVLANLNLVNRLLGEFSDHFRTNLAPHELKRIYDLVKNTPGENIRNLAINHGGALVCDEVTEDTGAYLLVPCAGLGNYEAIRNVVKNQFLVTALEKEAPVIEIQNAVGIDLLGQRTAAFLNLPYVKISLGNFRGKAVFEETIIYDNTGGAKKQTLDYLHTKLNAKVALSPFPFPTAAPNPDFVIILAPDIESELP